MVYFRTWLGRQNNDNPQSGCQPLKPGVFQTQVQSITATSICSVNLRDQL
jgi:hypothetical protein